MISDKDDSFEQQQRRYQQRSAQQQYNNHSNHSHGHQHRPRFAPSSIGGIGAASSTMNVPINEPNYDDGSGSCGGDSAGYGEFGSSPSMMAQHERLEPSLPGASSSVASSCSSASNKSSSSKAAKGTDKKNSGIREADVLCGRGRFSFNHAGNKRFRDVVLESLEDYKNATSRYEKSIVVKEIMDKIQSEGGRFLKHNQSAGRWIELTEQRAKEKVAHAVRDAAATIDNRKKATKRRLQQHQLLQQPGEDEDCGDVGDQRKALAKAEGDEEDEEEALPSMHVASAPMFETGGALNFHDACARASSAQASAYYRQRTAYGPPHDRMVLPSAAAAASSSSYQPPSFVSSSGPLIDHIGPSDVLPPIREPFDHPGITTSSPFVHGHGHGHGPALDPDVDEQRMLLEHLDKKDRPPIHSTGMTTINNNRAADGGHEEEDDFLAKINSVLGPHS